MYKDENKPRWTVQNIIITTVGSNKVIYQFSHVFRNTIGTDITPVQTVAEF